MDVRKIHLSGIAGVSIIVIGMVITAIGFRGRLGEFYSPLNHFVSELGEIGQSELSWVFNYGLIIGSICILVFMIGMGKYIGGWWGIVIGVLGFTTGFAGFLVGLFPMNNIVPHISVSMTFFNVGMVSTFIFSVYTYFFAGNKIPKYLGIPGLIAAVAFFIFLYLTEPMVPDNAPAESIIDLLGRNRSVIWPTAMMEWIVVLSVLFWIGLISIFLFKNNSTAK